MTEEALNRVCSRCENHQWAPAFTLVSIPDGCLIREKSIDMIKAAGIPATYWERVPKIFYNGTNWIRMWFRRLLLQNWIATIVGPDQSGKTSLLAAIMIKEIISATVRNCILEPDSIFLNIGPRTFKFIPSLSFGCKDINALYDVELLAIDDLDKVDVYYRQLARDVISYRYCKDLKTLLSATNIASLQAFYPGVYGLTDGAHVILRHSNSALLFKGSIYVK